MKASDEFRAICEPWLKELHSKARQIVAAGEQHMPMVVLNTPGGDMPIGVPVIETDEDKQLVAEMHRQVSDAYPACLILEAWTSTAATGDEADDKMRRYGRVRNMPDRSECIVFIFMWKGMQLLATAFIERRDDDDDLLEMPVKFLESALVDPSGDDSRGTFIHKEHEGWPQ
jgi:hypothetical protein